MFTLHVYHELHLELGAREDVARFVGVGECSLDTDEVNDNVKGGVQVHVQVNVNDLIGRARRFSATRAA